MTTSIVLLALLAGSSNPAGAATVIPGGGHYAGGFGQHQRDTFVFLVGNAAELTAVTSDGESGCSGDTVVRLSRVQGGERIAVAEDDDGGTSRCSRLDATVSPGVYELEIWGYGGQAVSAYSLDVAIPRRIGEGGGTVSGGFAASGRETVRFRLTQGRQVDLQTRGDDGDCPGDTLITLSAVGGSSAVASNDDGGVELCSRILATLQPGDYELDVVGYGGQGVPSFVIDVRVFEELPRARSTPVATRPASATVTSARSPLATVRCSCSRRAAAARSSCGPARPAGAQATRS